MSSFNGCIVFNVRLFFNVQTIHYWVFQRGGEKREKERERKKERERPRNINVYHKRQLHLDQ